MASELGSELWHSFFSISEFPSSGLGLVRPSVPSWSSLPGPDWDLSGLFALLPPCGCSLILYTPGRQPGAGVILVGPLTMSIYVRPWVMSAPWATEAQPLILGLSHMCESLYVLSPVHVATLMSSLVQLSRIARVAADNRIFCALC